MRRFYVASLGAIALLTTVSFTSDLPVFAAFREAGMAIAQNLRQPKVQLNLVAQKQLVALDEQGKEQVTWQDLKDQAVVQPGDVLRYTVTGENASETSAQDLAVTQPVPQGTTYVLASAASPSSAATTYSIDQGKTFVENPTVNVTLPDGTVETQPAPAEAYTHVRWTFGKSLDPAAVVKASYEVTVR